MNKGIIYIAGIAIVVLLSVILSLPPEELVDYSSITIVANLSITGSAGEAGVEQKDGLILAVEHLNSKGGINGKNVELVVVDNETNLEKAKKLFLETEEEHKPLLHISSTSFITTGLGPLAEENEVVLIALFAVAPTVTYEKEWVFRNYPTAESEARPIIEIVDNANIQDLGILYLDDEFGNSIKNVVTKNYENSKVEVTLESFREDTSDFTAHISKLHDKESIYIVGFPSHMEQIIIQLEEEKYLGETLLSSDGTTFEIVGLPEASNISVAAPRFYDTNFLLAKEVGFTFQEKFGRNFDANGANSYDTIRMLNALLDEKEISRKNLKDVLNSGFTYSGLFGKVQVPHNNHDISYKLFPSKIVDGKLDFGVKEI